MKEIFKKEGFQISEEALEILRKEGGINVPAWKFDLIKESIEIAKRSKKRKRIMPKQVLMAKTRISKDWTLNNKKRLKELKRKAGKDPNIIDEKRIDLINHLVEFSEERSKEAKKDLLKNKVKLLERKLDWNLKKHRKASSYSQSWKISRRIEEVEKQLEKAKEKYKKQKN
jgi:hypothetical protein